MTTARRVLLVNPVALYARQSVSLAFPLQPALVSLFSYLSAHGVPVDVLDLQVEIGTPQSVDDVPAVVAESSRCVLAREFDLLAVSCNSSFAFLGAWDLARSVRAADERAHIVVGGCHASVAPTDFSVPDSPFDVVVRGEGEVELLDLARDMAPRPSRTEVRDGRPLPLDSAFADFTGYPYWQPRQHYLLFPLSRGCPHRCTFCGGVERRAWRAYPPDVALGLARTMIAAGSEVVAFSDACFGLKPAWRRAVLAGLAENPPEAVLHWQTRINALNAADIDLMAALDVMVELGLETVSPRMAELMRKCRDGDAYVRESRELLAALGAKGIVSRLFVVLNHPGEDSQSLGETMAFMHELFESVGDLLACGNSNACAVFPGTSLLTESERWQRETGCVFGHPRWWHERVAHKRLSEDVRNSLPWSSIVEAGAEIDRLRAATIRAMPPSARLLWRRLSAPLPLPATPRPIP